MDRFVYNYHTLGGQPSNRLNYVVDNGTDYSSYEDIKSGQATGNYTYNKIGELIEDVSEDMELVWRTGDHKLSKIIRNDQDSPQLEFFYNPFGQRSMKVEKPRSGGSILNPSNWKYTYYAYDANGQVMAVYTGNFQGSSEQVKLSEQHLYGSERLGMMTRNVVMFDNGVTSYTHKEEDVVHGDERGYKRYELHGHTNSVLAVISDRKMYNSVDGNYEPVLISWADYYAFGMLQSGRHGSATSELYRYQFQSMETDRGISGEGNSYTTEFRQYDPRLGRWRSLDPLMAQFPWMSPYVAFDNNPVVFRDPLGLAAEGGGDKGKKGKKGSCPTCDNLGKSGGGKNQSEKIGNPDGNKHGGDGFFGKMINTIKEKMNDAWLKEQNKPEPIQQQTGHDLKRLEELSEKYAGTPEPKENSFIAFLRMLDNKMIGHGHDSDLHGEKLTNPNSKNFDAAPIKGVIEGEMNIEWFTGFRGYNNKLPSHSNIGDYTRNASSGITKLIKAFQELSQPFEGDDNSQTALQKVDDKVVEEKISTVVNINNSNDTITVVGSGHTGEKYYPKDTIDATTITKDKYNRIIKKEYKIWRGR